MKWDKPMTDQTSLRNLLQKPCLPVGTPRARKDGGKEGRKEKERKEETNVFPATTQASKDTPKKKGSQLWRNHPGTPEQERVREREREREKKEEEKEKGRRERGQVFPVTSKRPGTHQGEGCA